MCNINRDPLPPKFIPDHVSWGMLDLVCYVGRNPNATAFLLQFLCDLEVFVISASSSALLAVVDT